MRITRLETFLTHAGLRNYLFVRLTTDSGLTGIGEASLEWQERAVQTILEDWLAEQIVGVDPFDLEAAIGGLIRDQYQGGPTALTAISGVEIACWDLIGKACGQPVYKLLGGRAREQLPAYANGWYGGAQGPADYAELARAVVAQGYRALKFDPFGVAWKTLSPAQAQAAYDITAAVRQAVGGAVDLFIEFHGRLSVAAATEIGRRLAPLRPAWYEEPVTPHSLDHLREVKQALDVPIAAGERLYMLEEFARLAALRACDIVQLDLAHCGGLHMGKKVAALTQAADQQLAPHCSIGPVALCAAVHFGWATPHVRIQENFGDFDVPWRAALVRGWNPCAGGQYRLPTEPGLGIELDLEAIAQHPPQKNPFPSLWDDRWLKKLTQR